MKPCGMEELQDYYQRFLYTLPLVQVVQHPVSRL